MMMVSSCLLEGQFHLEISFSFFLTGLSNQRQSVKWDYWAKCYWPFVTKITTTITIRESSQHSEGWSNNNNIIIISSFNQKTMMIGMKEKMRVNKRYEEEKKNEDNWISSFSSCTLILIHFKSDKYLELRSSFKLIFVSSSKLNLYLHNDNHQLMLINCDNLFLIVETKRFQM